ncbi:MAG: ATP-binding cassette domain-containing protein [Paracoccaceae bacterium]
MALDLLEISLCRTGQKPLFAPLTLTVPAGQITTIMGPSGIGKSTLLSFIGGHLGRGWQSEGKLILNGQEITSQPAEQRRIGVMFQDAVLFPHLSVAENLAFGLKASVRGRTARDKAVAEALDQAGLTGMGGRDPASLSGGQKARVALMRSLLADPLALLLDEPFSRLDDSLRSDLRRFVFDHVRDRAIPVLMVTHDQSDADAAAGPIIALAKN